MPWKLAKTRFLRFYFKYLFFKKQKNTLTEKIKVSDCRQSEKSFYLQSFLFYNNVKAYIKQR
ncbi:hypothetical protein, partial [Listeria monocytogenes]|uniref:hypothetical protein n=1 Tax=Listeria monocytogenes TaxID=1639 RepID=UPI001CB7942B